MVFNTHYVKQLLFLLGVTCTSIMMHGQKTIHFADFGAGYEENGFLVRIAYNRQYGHHLLTLGGQVHFETLETGRGLDEDLNSRLYVLNLEYHYEILNLNERNFVIYIGGGGLAGYEDVDQLTLSQGRTLTQESTFVYGGQLGLTLEKYLFTVAHDNGVAIFVNVRQNYLSESNFGEYQFNAILGLRYLF